MEDYEPVATPMQTSCKLNTDDSKSTDQSNTGQWLVSYYMWQHLDQM